MRSLLVLILVSLAATALAQQRDKVTGNFSNTRFQEFALQVEAQTDFHFYYRLGDVDSVFVTVQATNELYQRYWSDALAGSPAIQHF